ncbi:hypothetical protein TIFTF001_002926 [Ficus carica]|uniref:Uncharacterized protein n=1 Tax=Ficus carica TaxID=3494 RepID=A0AA87ZDU0_FICCA|nr:hypothetical protein TIFTF001_002926 [Ficus carica]
MLVSRHRQRGGGAHQRWVAALTRVQRQWALARMLWLGFALEVAGCGRLSGPSAVRWLAWLSQAG